MMPTFGAVLGSLNSGLLQFQQWATGLEVPTDLRAGHAGWHGQSILDSPVKARRPSELCPKVICRKLPSQQSSNSELCLNDSCDMRRQQARKNCREAAEGSLMPTAVSRGILLNGSSSRGSRILSFRSVVPVFHWTGDNGLRAADRFIQAMRFFLHTKSTAARLS